MAWYYEMHGVSLGPVPETKLRDLLRQDMVTPETLVWTEGMDEWLPYRQTALALPPASAAKPSALVAPAGMHLCAECGQPFPEDDMLQYEQAWVCAACKPIFFQKIKEGVVAVQKLPYATIGARFGAIFIDGIIIDLIFLPPLLFFYGFAGLHHRGMSPEISVVVYLLQYFLPLGYETFFVGKYGATLGKMAMKIKVVRGDGSPLSYGRAAGRRLSKILSGMILLIGYLMAFWDDEKRALHDRICDTRVVNNFPGEIPLT
jgi:uncharacterized RDD family membrane protein YckC